MRDISRWQQEIALQLKPAWPSAALMQVSAFCAIELGLYTLQQLAPNDHAHALWALLSGYPFSEQAHPDWSTEHAHKLATVRHLLPFYRSPVPWQRALQQYRQIEERLRGYTVSSTLEHYDTRQPLLATRRWDIYEQAITQALPYQRVPLRWAGPGSYWFVDRKFRQSVTIPADIPLPALPVHHNLQGVAQRPAYAVTIEELRETASWMDSQLSRQNQSASWRERIDRIGLSMFNAQRTALLDSPALSLHGMVHLVGMVGSGKSTLMDVLAVCLTRRGLRVTVVVGDVMNALQRTELYELLGLQAAPILGQSNRTRHLQRLHRALSPDETITSSALLQRRFRWLSTACALDGLGSQTGPYDITDRPCTRLIPAGVEEERLHTCPFYGTCAYHTAQRELVDSALWVATPPSLIFTRIAPPVNQERLRFLELVIKRSDVILIDEADRVQIQLDMIFSPSQTLVSRAHDAWLSQLDELVAQRMSREGRAQLSDERVARWLQAHSIVQLAASRVYALLLQSTELRETIERDYFTGWLIFEQLTHKIASSTDEEDTKNAIVQQLMLIFEACANDPLGDSEDHPLAEFARRCVTSTNAERTRSELEHWLQSYIPSHQATPERVNTFATLLEFGLASAVLSHRLDMVIRDWRYVEGSLQLEQAGSQLFHRPPDDYAPEVPAAPMGNILAFQYLQNEQPREAGELRFFRCMGVGRWLLLNLHSRFALDGHAKPHVVLLSATSWSGAAPGFDIQLPVTGILRVPKGEVQAIRSSTFEYMPILDKRAQPLRISGRRGQDRTDALRQMLTQLARRSSTSSTSMLEQLRDELPPERQRLLLVVGSYEEARQARIALDTLRPDWIGRVLHLVSDEQSVESAWSQDSEGLQRGMVHAFGTTDAWILIAPLLAIERGHNILNQYQQAAIGAALFLIRPHLRPDDLGFAIGSVNRWAVDYFKQSATYDQETKVEPLARAFRIAAFQQWRDLMHLPLRYSTLPEQEHSAVTWEHLVTIWQVIGRLVRGGVAARVYFCDAAFAPLCKWNRPRWEAQDQPAAQHDRRAATLFHRYT